MEITSKQGPAKINGFVANVDMHLTFNQDGNEFDSHRAH